MRVESFNAPEPICTPNRSLVELRRNGALSRILPVHAPCSEWLLIPDQPFADRAAKDEKEPKPTELLQRR